jgi:membrane-associated phospholipid phosphatase
VLSAAWVVAVTVGLQSSPSTTSTSTASTASTASTTQAIEEQEPITHLGQNLVRDLKALGTRNSAILLGLGVAATGASHPSDDDVAAWVAQQGGSLSYTPIGGLIGNEWFQGGAAVGTYVIGRLQDSPAIAHIGSDLIRAQLLNGVLTLGLKVAIDRDRPDGGERSFPSGHTSATFASAAVLDSHFGWKVGIPAYAVAGFVGWTRIRDNQHWLTDVVFGSAIGIVAGKAVTQGHQIAGWTVAPSVTPRSAAIYFIKN